MKTLKMVLPHANFKVFKVGPSARGPTLHNRRCPMTRPAAQQPIQRNENWASDPPQSAETLKNACPIPCRTPLGRKKTTLGCLRAPNCPQPVRRASPLPCRGSGLAAPRGRKENEDLEHGGGTLLFTNFSNFRVLPRAGVQL